jgi:hypothetical protein
MHGNLMSINIIKPPATQIASAEPSPNDSGKTPDTTLTAHTTSAGNWTSNTDSFAAGQTSQVNCDEGEPTPLIEHALIETDSMPTEETPLPPTMVHAQGPAGSVTDRKTYRVSRRDSHAAPARK